jgi:hypothetical protein
MYTMRLMPIEIRRRTRSEYSGRNTTIPAEEGCTIYNLEKIHQILEKKFKRRRFIERWIENGQFKTRFLAVTSKTGIYSISSHPQFTGRLIPPDAPPNSFVRTGWKCWNNFKQSVKYNKQYVMENIHVIRAAPR